MPARQEMFYGASPKIFDRARKLRSEMTIAESSLWSAISNNQLFNPKFRRQHPLNFFIADFYCHKLKLVIEVDGDAHDSLDQKDYDGGRTEELNKFGIKVIRFTNDQVLNQVDDVLISIRNLCEERMKELRIEIQDDEK